MIYIHQFSDEKNWVPWEGSSLMTYPRYPGFEPHTVIEWNSYDSPLDVLEFKSVAPEPFMQEYRQETGGWIRWGGQGGNGLDQVQGPPGVKY